MKGKIFWPLVMAVATAVLMAGCRKEEKVEPEAAELERVVLVYAVASNNLYSNLLEDKEEMIAGAANADLKKVSLMVYEETTNDIPRLLELKRAKDGTLDFQEVKSYPGYNYSTDPRRISEVMSDVHEMRKARNYGLVLWSHGTGWDPSFPTHGYDYKAKTTPGLVYSFGMDKNPEISSDYSDSIDIDELAGAIPSGMFDFIWFDACYMSSIEMIYELKGKCDWFVGYPTEVYTPGMPYDITMPDLLKEKPDLVKAAKGFFDYYAEYPSSSMRVATVAVVDMSGLDAVADACATAIQGYDGTLSDYSYIIQKYSRILRKNGKLYDFEAYDLGQLAKESVRFNPELSEEAKAFLKSGVDEALGKMVVWKAATPTDFDWRPIDADNFSGVSMHLFDPSSETAESKYYRTLGWYKRVF